MKQNDTNLIPLLECFGLKVDLAPLSMQRKPQLSKLVQNSDIMHAVSKIRSIGDDEFSARSPLFSITFKSVKTFEPSTVSSNHFKRPDDKIQDVNKIQIEIKFIMESSPTEFVKYCSGTASNIEENILNKYVQIIDVDTQRNQVYFKIKTGIEKSDGSGLYERFIIIGKFDSTNYGFIFDMSSYTQSPPKSIEKMYKDNTPQEFKNKCKASHSGGGTKYEDNKDIGIKRMGFSGFVVSNTNHKLRLKRDRRCRRDINNISDTPYPLKSPINKNYGLFFTSTKVFSGNYDIGFYNYDTTRRGRFQAGDTFDYYTTELTQEISS